MLHRIVRDASIACVTLALAALALRPQRPQVALGIVAGGVLMGIAFWAIRGLADQLTRGGGEGEMRPVSRVFPLVKFFTRHAILALVGYVMMVRLHLDAVGMLVGVTSVVLATAIEATRRR